MHIGFTLLQLPSMPYAVTDKLHFLSEAGKILSASLDYDTTLANVAKLIVSNVADFCIIDLFEGKTMRRVVIKIADPKKQKFANLAYHFPPNPKNKDAIYDAAKKGNPIIITKATKKWLQSVSQIEEEREFVKSLKLNSHIFAPLKSRGKVIGVLTVASSDPNFSYSKEDAEFIQELAARAGTAVDKAVLYKEAQEAIKTRDEFLSIASHELKTPLTSILLNLQFVLEKINTAKKGHLNIGQISNMLETSRKQTQRMTRLINDLSNVSLISTGKIDLEKDRVDLVELVQDVLKRFEQLIKREQVKIKIQANTAVIGNWDRVRLEQVVANIVSNAIKYGNKKPITITVSKNKNEAIIQVKDCGMGIKKKDQGKIFDRFQRTTSAKKISGLGVGLYISNQIVLAHGGKITVESKEGKGSTFTILLPI